MTVNRLTRSSWLAPKQRLDSKGRYAGNALWGDGWGWSWFDVGDPLKTTSTDYKTDCLSCHLPAEASDRIYVRGTLKQ